MQFCPRVHTVILSFALKLLRCLQQSFLCGRVEGTRQQLFPKDTFLPSFSLLLSFLYLITLSTKKNREAKNLFQNHPGAMEHAPENITRCSHVSNFGKLELSNHQL